MQAAFTGNTFGRPRTLIARRHLILYPKILSYRNSAALHASSGDEELIWGDESIPDTSEGAFTWLEEQENLLGTLAEAEAEEEQLAASVGIHVRGDTVLRDAKLRDETDDSRFHWHRMLHSCADRGDFTNAESIIKQMNENNQLPGAKAYHALIFSYVKAGYSRGALNAIRAEVGKGIRPLPQTYAAVLTAFLREGDIETAIAIYASNRRAGVSFDGSWRTLCSALFNNGDYDHAMQILTQGESDGLKPDTTMYQAMIESMCRKGDLQESLRRLKEMTSSGVIPDKKILSAVITAHALSGKVQESEKLLKALIRAPGTPSAMTIGCINAVLQMYLHTNLSKEGLAERISKLRQQMIKGGMALDRKGYSLLLEASVLLEDPKVGWLAFQSLQTQPRGCLQYIKDSVIADFMYELSLAGEPSKIDTVLAAFTTERRSLSSKMMIVDERGRTFITGWLDQVVTDHLPRSRVITIDGVVLDSTSLCALNADGECLAPTKMSVRELRAELAARQYPLRGNKKELIKQLQKARVEADIEGVTQSTIKTTKSKKIDVIIAEESWNTGNLENRNFYEDEREVVPDEDDDDGNPDDVEFDENGKSKDEEDEEDNFDYEDRVFSVMKARGKQFDFHENANFDHENPGLHEAILLLRRVLALGAHPTKGDIQYLVEAVSADTSDLAIELVEILSALPIALEEETMLKLRDVIQDV